MSDERTDNTMALYHALERIDELEALNEKLTAALKEKMIFTEGAWVRRKQAEAVEAAAEKLHEGDEITIAYRLLYDYAARLIQQADQMEADMGEVRRG